MVSRPLSIFIPKASDVDQSPSKDQSCAGTVIHVVGNPMIGFHHQFKRNFNTYGWKTLVTAVLLGHIQQSLHVDPSTEGYSEDTVPLGALDAAALQVPPPGKSDVRAPVDGVVNRRCQEWTLEYVQHLASLGYLDSGAIQLAQDHRDPLTHGVMLRRKSKRQQHWTRCAMIKIINENPRFLNLGMVDPRCSVDL